MSAANLPNDSRTKEKGALLVACLTSFMLPFSLSSVNVAMPSIEVDLGMDAVQLSWLATAYLLATAIFLVPAGRLADIIGRKKVFIVGLAIFTVVSTLAAFVPSAAWLIMFRILQGMGAALFTTTGMAILTSIIPPRRRGRAIGIYVSAVYLGLSAGPFLGGLLTQYLGWRSVFLILLPMGMVPIWVTLKYLKGEWADAKGEPFDWLGSLLYGVAILVLVYGATKLPGIKAVLMICTAGIGLVIFIWQEKRTPHPVFNISLFQTNRTFLFSSIAAVIHYSATFSLAFLLSLYLQYVRGMQPQFAGMLLVTQPLIMTIFSPVAGRWSDRVPPRHIASLGMGITAVGLGAFILLTADTSLWLIGANLTLLGVGFSLFSSPNMNAIMGSVAKRHFGIASGVLATMRLLGQMASMAITTTILAIFIGDQALLPAFHDLFIRCMHYNFIIFTCLCVIGVFFSFFRGRK
jgi:EmrB/QacA subfamily drug resistance transporter